MHDGIQLECGASTVGSDSFNSLTTEIITSSAPYQSSEGDPWEAAAGARSPGTAAQSPASRAAEQGTV